MPAGAPAGRCRRRRLVVGATAAVGVAAAAFAGLDCRDVVRIGTFIVDHEPDKLEFLVTAVHRIWGDRPPAQTLVVAALALPDMLFEVEAVATRT